MLFNHFSATDSFDITDIALVLRPHVLIYSMWEQPFKTQMYPSDKNK